MIMELKKEYSGKNVLITGGLGLLGSNLAHKLVDLGANVTILDALLPLYGGNKHNIHGIENKVKTVIGDIRDESTVVDLVKNQDIVFNFAAQVSYTDSLKDPLLDLDINCRGHLIVLEACRKHNPDARLIFSGSRMQFGRIQYNPVDEKHPQEPLSIYGVHKMCGEKYYLAYNKNFGLETTVFRIANPYGPRSQMKHSKYSIINWFVRMAMEGETIKVFGDGKQKRDYIYVDDLIKAFLLAGVSERSVGEVFNVGSGVPTEFIEMVKTVVDIAGSGCIKQVPWPENYTNIETGDYVTNIKKISTYLGWKPEVGLREGLEKTVEFYRENKGHYW